MRVRVLFSGFCFDGVPRSILQACDGVSGMRLGWVLDDRRHWAFFPSCSTGFCENCSQ